jgi:hypothetical protein
MREIRTSGSEGGGPGNSTGSPYPIDHRLGRAKLAALALLADRPYPPAVRSKTRVRQEDPRPGLGTASAVSVAPPPVGGVLLDAAVSTAGPRASRSGPGDPLSRIASGRRSLSLLRGDRTAGRLFLDPAQRQRQPDSAASQPPYSIQSAWLDRESACCCGFSEPKHQIPMSKESCYLSEHPSNALLKRSRMLNSMSRESDWRLLPPSIKCFQGAMLPPSTRLVGGKDEEEQPDEAGYEPGTLGGEERDLGPQLDIKAALPTEEVSLRSMSDD